MSNQTEDTQAIPDVQETQEIEVAQEQSEVETSTPENASEQEPIIEQSIEDRWESLDLTTVLSESSEEPTETGDATVPSEDETAFPPEGSDTDAEIAKEEERSEEELLQLDPNKPAPLSRRKAQKIVESVIEPLRDGNVPIKNVLESMAEFHPTRTQELA